MVGQHTSNEGQKLVANLSLGGGCSNSINTAVQHMVAASIVVAVAAGKKTDMLAMHCLLLLWMLSPLVLLLNLMLVLLILIGDLVWASWHQAWVFLAPGSIVIPVLALSAASPWRLLM